MERFVRFLRSFPWLRTNRTAAEEITTRPKSCALPGLVNNAAICYANAVFQCLAFCDYLSGSVEMNAQHVENDMVLTGSFCRVIDFLVAAREKKSGKPEKLTGYLKLLADSDIGFEPQGFQDAHDFFLCTLNAIEEEYEDVIGGLDKCFTRGLFNYQILFKFADDPDNPDKQYQNSISISASEYDDVQSMLHDHFKPMSTLEEQGEEVEESEYEVKIVGPPPKILAVNLKIDLSGESHRQAVYRLPFVIHIQPDYFLEVPKLGTEYLLKSVAVYQHGHYVALVLHEDAWYEIDDTVSSTVPVEKSVSGSRKRSNVAKELMLKDGRIPIVSFYEQTNEVGERKKKKVDEADLWIEFD